MLSGSVVDNNVLSYINCRTRMNDFSCVIFFRFDTVLDIHSIFMNDFNSIFRN